MPVPGSKDGRFLLDAMLFFGGGSVLAYGLSRLPLTGLTEKTVVTLLIGCANIALLRSSLRLRYAGYWAMVSGAIGMSYFISVKVGVYPFVTVFGGRWSVISAGWYSLLLVAGLWIIRRVRNQLIAEPAAKHGGGGHC
jgi:hypothetical protein